MSSTTKTNDSANSNSASSDSTQLTKKKIWLGGCRYDVVCRAALESGFELVPEHETWHISWSDAPLAPEKITEMRRPQNAPGTESPVIQKLNHFPGMYEICRKDRLGRNLNRLKKIFPGEYDFFPSTWDLPSDMSDLLDYWKKNKNATFIVKPDSGCQGKGIFLIRNLKLLCPFAKCVCQLYIAHPFLVDGYKFDQRIYVLLTSVDPLRVYIYKEGIARFATVKYRLPSDNNLDVVFMHLTNYSLNKFSESYDPQGDGSKRKLSDVYKWMKAEGHNVKKLKDAIDDIVIKTVVCVAPTLRHNYRASFPKRDGSCSCFEVLGFDILVDRHLNPMLVEVNHSPSFNLDMPVDKEVKMDLVRDILSLLCLQDDSHGDSGKSVPSKQEKHTSQRRPGTPKTPVIKLSSTVSGRLKHQFAHEEKHLGNFRLIFSEESPGFYAKFLDKEYNRADVDDEQCFLKNRPQPVLHIGSMSDVWANGPKTYTCRRRTQNGKLYVETTPITPGVLDPTAFLKFKFNAASVTPRSSHTSNSIQRPILFDNNDVILQDVDRLSTSIAMRHNEIDIMRPVIASNQRVQMALEKLQQRNVQKFKLLTSQPQNKDSMRRSCSQMCAFTDQSCSQLQDAIPMWTKPLKKSKGISKLKRDKNNNLWRSRSSMKSLEQPELDAKVLLLDSSKLPSVFHEEIETTECKEKPTLPPNFGNQEFITSWVTNGVTLSNLLKSNNPKINSGYETSQNMHSENNDFANSEPISSHSKSSRNLNSSFQSSPFDEREERTRKKRLIGRKRALKHLGISETVNQIVEMLAVPDRKEF